MSFRRLLLCLMLLPVFASAAPYTVFRDGETLRYRVSWGIFSTAGEILITAQREVLDGRPVFRVTMDTASRGLIRGLYSYDNRAEAIIDEATGRIIRAREKGGDGKRASDTETVFDYAKRLAKHTDQAHPERNHEFAIPAGDPVDLISALVGTRTWQIPLGDKRGVLVFSGNDLYPLSIYADKLETLRTSHGAQSALVLVPRMETEAPRGVFKRGGEIKVWVSQDADRQPVKMQLKLKYGTAALTLVEHTIKPPTPGSIVQAP